MLFVSDLLSEGWSSELRIYSTISFFFLWLSFIETSWSQDYILTLEEAIELAFQHNPDLNIGRFTAQGAEAHKGVIFAGFLPTLTGIANYQRQTGNFSPRPGLVPSTFKLQTSPSNQSYDFFSFSITLQQTLFDFGRQWNAYDSSSKSANASWMDLENLRQQVHFAVVSQYVTVVANQEMVSLSERLLEQAKIHEEKARTMVTQGLRTRLDLLRAQVEREMAEANLLKAKSELSISKKNLLSVIGLSKLQSFQVIAPSYSGNQEIPKSLEEAIDEATKNRPDRASLVSKISAQESVVKSLKAQWFPIISATASFSDTGTEIKDLVWNWNIGISITVPLFTGLLPYYQVREAEASLHGLQERLRAMDIQIKKDIEQAWERLKVAQERVKVLTSAVNASRENLALAEGRFETGIGTSVEVFDASVALANAELSLISARLDFELAWAMLVKAIGKIPNSTSRRGFR